jgi:hypothetical protein
MAKAKQSGMKNLLLGKVEIPRTQDPIDERIDKGKRMMVIIDLNEMAFTELILPIDTTSSSGKIPLVLLRVAKPISMKMVTQHWHGGN